MVNKDSYIGYGKFWNRLKKKIQSYFICRPQSIQLAGAITDKRIADIGYGEGYVSRILSNLGANVIGIDISSTLIKRAIKTKRELKQGIQYHVADALPFYMIYKLMKGGLSK